RRPGSNLTWARADDMALPSGCESSRDACPVRLPRMSRRGYVVGPMRAVGPSAEDGPTPTPAQATPRTTQGAAMKKPHLTRRVTIIGATVAAVAAGGSAAALATTAGSSGDVYQGCLNHSLGAIYNIKVNPTSPPGCLPHDALMKWNQTGPAGAPGAAGPKGD